MSGRYKDPPKRGAAVTAILDAVAAELAAIGELEVLQQYHEASDRITELTTMLSRSLTLVLAHVCHGDSTRAGSALEATFDHMTKSMHGSLKAAAHTEAVKRKFAR